MEKLGYLLIAGFFVLITYLTLDQLYGLSLVNEFYPDGLVILLIYGGLFVLFIKVLRERLNNKEDDYYSKEIKK
ncbi:MAG: hypothetical protein VX176_01330 [Candidatus Neomarinimicrobiota bacterium]|nr:hypothetical protein [Candidatus Neomarinimicrobiota bacterium]